MVKTGFEESEVGYVEVEAEKLEALRTGEIRPLQFCCDL